MKGIKSLNAPERAICRLVELLSAAGASAVVSEIDPARVAVLVSRAGTTLTRGLLPLAAARDAESRGLAVWDAQRRLRLTDTGYAFAKRLAAPADVDGFVAQHADVARRTIDPGAPPALVNEGESPLIWLARRKDRDGRPFLDPHQIEAGERYRRDVEQAQLLQRVTANWDVGAAATRGAGGQPTPIGDLALDARGRLAKAAEAVGPDLAGLLTDVCGFLKGLEIVERERGWPARSGKIVLRIALDRLACCYGLAATARGPARGDLRHWGDADYRPRV
jgi:hypothetical protein